jgi:hypothetical protein
VRRNTPNYTPGFNKEKFCLARPMRQPRQHYNLAACTSQVPLPLVPFRYGSNFFANRIQCPECPSLSLKSILRPRKNRTACRSTHQGKGPLYPALSTPLSHSEKSSPLTYAFNSNRKSCCPLSLIYSWRSLIT